jgi:hypothetical protein
MVNGQMILGLQMASKAFRIIHGVELGKPHMFPEGSRNSARSYNGIRGRGESKKRMAIGNKLYRGSIFALIRKDADLLYGVLLCE